MYEQNDSSVFASWWWGLGQKSSTVEEGVSDGKKSVGCGACEYISARGRIPRLSDTFMSRDSLVLLLLQCNQIILANQTNINPIQWQ